MVAACASPDPKSDPATRSLTAELPPAELPTYAKGDRFTYDNPEESWTVEGARKGLVASAIASCLIFSGKATSQRGDLGHDNT